MAKINRLSRCTDWIDLDFVERQRTPERAIKLGIHLQLAGLSLSNTVSVLEELGVERSRKAIHDWVQKADLQSTEGQSPNHVAVDETVIRINDQQFWLYAVTRTQSVLVDSREQSSRECRRSRDERAAAPAVVCDYNDRINRDLSPRTSPETQCRICRISGRWRSTPPNCAGQSWTPISNRTKWKSERHRAYFLRVQTQNFLVLKLLQSR